MPVAGADRLKLSSHIVFDDLMAVARFALYPDDDLSLAEVLRSPLLRRIDFGDGASIALAGATAQGPQLWRTLRERADEHPSGPRARDLLAGRHADRARAVPFAFSPRC